MLQTSVVVYCAVDSLLPIGGRIQPGFEDFSAALEHAGVPQVWVSRRTRFQLDEVRRRLGHNHPFIAEGGCGVYLPEGYFHLRPAKTLRLGRFTCIPVAQPQPAASQALEQLSAETCVAVVPLASLSPRELAHNLGVPGKQAELARHHDFDELFFFAGGSAQDIERFAIEARQRKLQLRQTGALWSLAAGASVKQCVADLAQLYQRALHSRPVSIAIAAPAEATDLFPACDRSVLLQDASLEDTPESAGVKASREIPLNSPHAWEDLLEAILPPRQGQHRK